jgi:RecJ-like exonuclease
VKTDDNLGVAPALEIPCEHCDGKGELVEDGQCVACYWCDGDGDVLTEFGRSILELAWKHFGCLPYPKRIDEGRD